ncbi:MAG: hypothetical protein EBR82_29660 [Caulobacteraceae bacterium]|nr:hypothetical protein [Caulobacteraceae bacterium]
MNLLFDTSPEEVPDQKKKKTARKKPATEPARPAQVTEIRPVEIIGRSDGDYTCDCGSTYFDILDDFRGKWLIECCFCGFKMDVLAVRTLRPAVPEFVFFDGRHSGMTLAQVSETEQGMAYIKWCAEKHKSGSVKEACKEWLVSVGYTATQR